MVSHKEQYDADSLTVLEGLDAVRKRPGMYIGTTDSQGLMHCLWEIIDNAVDEALAGACDHIIVTLHDDGSIEVADNGRGIPVDVEPKTKLTGVEVVLTKLHAGAKFGNASYNAAGGLHGVGSSVVNALSLRLDVEVDRDGKTHHMAFHQGHPGVYSDADPEHPSPASPFKRTRKNKPTELEIIGTVSPKTIGTTRPNMSISYFCFKGIAFPKLERFGRHHVIMPINKHGFRHWVDHLFGINNRISLGRHDFYFVYSCHEEQLFPSVSAGNHILVMFWLCTYAGDADKTKKLIQHSFLVFFDVGLHDC